LRSVSPSPLIKSDAQFSRIRFSDWLHHKAHDGNTLRTPAIIMIAVRLQDVDMMGEPVEQGAGEPFGAFWQAVNPSPKAVCVLPVPDGPSAMQFWRLSIHSQRISSRTAPCSATAGRRSRTHRSSWSGGNAPAECAAPRCGARDRCARVRTGAADSGVIGAVLRRFHGDPLILARECGKLQGLEMIAEQHLGRDDRRRLL
jgi:hypothetical protein